MTKDELKELHMRIKSNDVVFGDFIELKKDDRVDAVTSASNTILNHGFESARDQCATAKHFHFAVLVEMTGCWHSGGIAVGVISNGPKLVPHVSPALREFEMSDCAEKFDEIVSLFPATLQFEDGNTQAFCDVINDMEKNSKAYEMAIENAEQVFEKRIGLKFEEAFEPCWLYLKANVERRVWR